jgi:thymidylate synthase
MLTTKKMFTRGIIREILWYLKGGSDNKYLLEHNVHIWDEWARENDDLGPIYGYQWRKWPKFVETSKMMINDGPGAYEKYLHMGHWEHIDQIASLVDKLKNNPNDRRMIVSAWNVADLPDMALPPCHYAFQCFARPLILMERMRLAGKIYHPNEILENTTEETLETWLDQVNTPKYELSLMLNQRSCDIGLGVPFNIVQYSILLRMFCEVANMVPGDFIWNGGDVHIYDNHITQLTEQLTREPYESPTFKFARTVTSIDDFKFEDFVIEGYTSHPTLPMDVAK